jgi:hypothetical protein
MAKQGGPSEREAAVAVLAVEADHGDDSSSDGGKVVRDGVTGAVWLGKDGWTASRAPDESEVPSGRRPFWRRRGDGRCEG